jgi:hypothetical protein
MPVRMPKKRCMGSLTNLAIGAVVGCWIVLSLWLVATAVSNLPKHVKHHPIRRS